LTSNEQEGNKTATCYRCGHPDKRVGKTRRYILREKAGTSVAGGGTSLTHISYFRTVAEREVSICDECLKSKQRKTSIVSRIWCYVFLGIALVSLALAPIAYFSDDGREVWFVFLFGAGAFAVGAFLTRLEMDDNYATNKCLEEAAHKYFAANYTVSNKSEIRPAIQSSDKLIEPRDSTRNGR
jgi:hypothetical protein